MLYMKVVKSKLQEFLLQKGKKNLCFLFSIYMKW